MLAIATLRLAASEQAQLSAAIRNRDKASILRLVRDPGQVSRADPDGSTPLHWAVYLDDFETVDLLLAAKAGVNAANDVGVTPLDLAASNGSAGMVEKLLAAGAIANVASATGVTPLMKASRAGCLDAVRMLLAHGADPNPVETTAGQTALMWAVAEKHPEVVRELLLHGADPEARSYTRELWVILNPGYTTGTVDNTKDRACGKADGPCAEVKVGGSPALLFAGRNGCLECARALLDRDAKLNALAADGNSALVVAAHSGEAAVAQFLLDRGADPNAYGAGYTAVHAAVLRGEMDLLRALLAHKADPNLRMKNGTAMRMSGPDYALPATLAGATPFVLAARYASPDMMRVLAAAGADVKLRANDGTTALLAASGANQRTGHGSVQPAMDETHELAAVAAVIELGADLDAVNAAGDTALHIAASRGYKSVVGALLEKGAKADVRNHDGRTPLDLAAARANGASPASDKFKATAELLRKSGRPE